MTFGDDGARRLRREVVPVPRRSVLLEDADEAGLHARPFEELARVLVAERVVGGAAARRR